MDEQVQEMTTGAVEVPAVEVKERKPRTRKQSQANLVVPAPTLLDGARDNSLAPTIEKKYSAIYVMKPDGKKVHLVVRADAKSKEKAHALTTALKNGIYAIIGACLAGQGQGPDGSAKWVVENWPTINKFYQGRLDKYQLKVVPAGRSGIQSYSAPIGTWVKIAQAKYDLIKASLKVSATAKHQTVVRKAEVKDEPNIVF